MKKNAGFLVETKTGLKGRTYHHEAPVNGKTIVHLEDEKSPNMLCKFNTLKIIGYVD